MSLLSSYRRLSKPSKYVSAFSLVVAAIMAFWHFCGPPLMTRWLIDAVHRGDVAAVRRLLHWGANPNYAKSFYFSEFGTSEIGPWTALDTAASQGRTDMVALMLDSGADVNARDKGGMTPLMWAFHHLGPSDTLPLLLAHGADVHVRSNDGATPLHDAATNGIGRQIELLLNYGADINASDDADDTPLCCAIRWNKVEEARILIAQGANLNVNKARSRKAFMEAAENGCVAMLKLLLQHGIHVNTRTDGKTLLQAAVVQGQADAVRLLLTHGAAPNILTSEKISLLQAADAASKEDTQDLTAKQKWNSIRRQLNRAGAKRRSK